MRDCTKRALALPEAGCSQDVQAGSEARRSVEAYRGQLPNLTGRRTSGTGAACWVCGILFFCNLGRMAIVNSVCEYTHKRNLQNSVLVKITMA